METTLETLARRKIGPKNVDWIVVLGISAMHIGSLVTPFYFSWSAAAVFLMMVPVTACLGITLCYHRLLTHHSFKTPGWFEFLLTTCACLAWQGGPIQWVGVHRLHHMHSDKDLDPHSPQHGFTWAHMFWCMVKKPDGFDPAEITCDLAHSRVLHILNTFFWVPQIIFTVGLYYAGEWASSTWIGGSGISWVVWGVFLRTTVVYHGTWFVNSACHTWGYRNYETRDRSTNLWWVAILAFGEGWHNNHHKFQWSARHGLRKSEPDLTYLLICFLEKIGLAWDVKLPKTLSE